MEKAGGGEPMLRGKGVDLPKRQRLGGLADTVELPTQFEAVDSFSSGAHFSFGSFHLEIVLRRVNNAWMPATNPRRLRTHSHRKSKGLTCANCRARKVRLKRKEEEEEKRKRKMVGEKQETDTCVMI